MIETRSYLRAAQLTLGPGVSMLFRISGGGPGGGGRLLTHRMPHKHWLLVGLDSSVSNSVSYLGWWITGGVMKAKVSLLARINDGTKAFPFVTVEISRRGIKLPVEHNGKIYMDDKILGFYVRYTDNGKRKIEKIGKDDLV